jgi:hypothetical protein
MCHIIEPIHLSVEEKLKPFAKPIQYTLKLDLLRQTKPNQTKPLGCLDPVKQFGRLAVWPFSSLAFGIEPTKW